ncbi:hypothetical protein HPB47_025380 [Ixodes persulcatus]|uniref:Uncharacterized protein n=1 Tax=Ixodes persulcatus TaxID=34615 RepID=A0AC60Q3X6_IXOPE|nr:hypothetical protein HPB47_025380 [Ixodes persulcatus]
MYVAALWSRIRPVPSVPKAFASRRTGPSEGPGCPTMAVRGPRATPVGLPQAMSPESALASDIFDQFVSAGTFKAALSTYRQASALHVLRRTTELTA